VRYPPGGRASVDGCRPLLTRHTSTCSYRPYLQATSSMLNLKTRTVVTGSKWTRQNVYENNCIFFEENKPYECRSVGRTECEWGRPWHVHHKQWSCCHDSRLSSAQLSLTCFRERYTLLSCRVFSLWNSINQQILKLAIGCKSFSILSQVMGRPFHVPDLPEEFHQLAFPSGFFASNFPNAVIFILKYKHLWEKVRH
jgi:hypothetical protein